MNYYYKVNYSIMAEKEQDQDQRKAGQVPCPCQQESQWYTVQDRPVVRYLGRGEGLTCNLSIKYWQANTQ